MKNILTMIYISTTFLLSGCAFNYMTNGVAKTFEEASKWEKLQIDPKLALDFKSIGVNTPEEVSKWKKLSNQNNFNTFMIAKKWKKIGIHTPEEAKEWKDIDISLNDISICRKTGINTPKEAQQWIHLGYSYNICRSVSKWKSAEINTPEEAKEWKDAGFTLKDIEDIQLCKRVGISSSEAKEWKSVGIRLKDIQKWKDAGVKNPTQASEWLSLGYSYKEFASLSKNGITLNEVKEWKNAGIESKDIQKWKDIGVKSPTQASEWLSLGYSYEKLASLSKSGVTLKEVKKWIKLGINDFKFIKFFKELNLKPTPLIVSIFKNRSLLGINIFSTKSKEDFLSRLKLLRKFKCKTIENRPFSIADPYNNKNKCYQYVGRLFQRISENTGLVVGLSKQIFFVNFDETWLENDMRFGVIKGTGKFSYTTTNGAQKVVPKGQVVFNSFNGYMGLGLNLSSR